MKIIPVKVFTKHHSRVINRNKWYALLMGSPLSAITTVLCAVALLSAAGNGYPAEKTAEPSTASAPGPIVPLENKAKVDYDAVPALRGEYFLIERPRIGLLGSFKYDSETVNNRGEERESSVFEFREGFTVATRGWMYHPALFLFDVQVEPQWSQIDESGDGPKSDDTRFFIPGYSLDGTLLPEKPYTLHIFADRHEDNLVAAFTNQSTVELDSYGADLSLKNRTLPSFFRYQHLQRIQEGFFISEEDRDDFRADVFHQKGNSDTRLNVQYIDSLQTSGETTSDVQNSFNYLSNTWRFDSDPTRRLTSTVNYNKTTDEDFTSSNLRLLERLYYTHRKNLWSKLSLLYDRHEVDLFEEETASLGGNVKHLLYENLTTTLSADAARKTFPDSDENIYESGLHFDYLRDIPWGSLNATTGLDSVYTERSGNVGQLAASNVPLVLANGDAPFLRDEFIDRDSIRVTDSTRTIVYIRDQDYTIEDVGTFVRIRRTFFGAIQNNQTVLVSYRFTGDSGFDDNLISQSYGTTLNLFSAVRLSYNFFNTSQQIVSGIEPVTPVDDTIHRAVLQLFWKWSETRFSYEDFSTSTAPSRNTWRAEETLTANPTKNLALQLSGYFGETGFSEDIARDEFHGVTSNILWSPAYWARTGVEGWYDQVSGERTDSSVGGLLSFLELYYGKWRCNLSHRYLDSDDQLRDFQRTEHRFLVKLLREL
jgi:hypothetical protein